jgi:hypothetical protein
VFFHYSVDCVSRWAALLRVRFTRFAHSFQQLCLGSAAPLGTLAKFEDY